MALPVGAVFFVFIINFVSFLDTLVLFRILLPHRDILVDTGLSDCFPGLHDLLHAYLTFFASVYTLWALVYGLIRRWLATELTLSPLVATY